MNLDPLADFYVLEAIRARAPEGHPLAQEAARLRDHVAEALAQCFWDYAVLISAGEARHARNRASLFHYEEFPAGAGRNTIYEMAPEFEPQALLAKLVPLFRKQHWGGSFGGEKWAKIAEFAAKRAQYTPAVFVDHVADMEHNGGNLFNKTSVHTVMDFQVGWHQSLSLLDFLQVKMTTKDLLADPNARIRFLALPVGRLLIGAYAAFGITPPPWGWATNLTPSPLPTYKPLIWGTKELGEPVNKKEKPHGQKAKGQGPTPIGEALASNVFAGITISAGKLVEPVGEGDGESIYEGDDEGVYAPVVPATFVDYDDFLAGVEKLLQKEG